MGFYNKCCVCGQAGKHVGKQHFHNTVFSLVCPVAILTSHCHVDFSNFHASFTHPSQICWPHTDISCQTNFVRPKERETKDFVIPFKKLSTACSTHYGKCPTSSCIFEITVDYMCKHSSEFLLLLNSLQKNNTM